MFKLQKWQTGLAIGLATKAIAVNFLSCVSIPNGEREVSPFQKDRYFGK
ncbi:hypothetical protein [Pedobacter sp. JCM 36344]